MSYKNFYSVPIVRMNSTDGLHWTYEIEVDEESVHIRYLEDKEIKNEERYTKFFAKEVFETAIKMIDLHDSMNGEG